MQPAASAHSLHSQLFFSNGKNRKNRLRACHFADRPHPLWNAPKTLAREISTVTFYQYENFFEMLRSKIPVCDANYSMHTNQMKIKAATIPAQKLHAYPDFLGINKCLAARWYAACRLTWWLPFDFSSFCCLIFHLSCSPSYSLSAQCNRFLRWALFFWNIRAATQCVTLICPIVSSTKRSSCDLKCDLRDLWSRRLKPGTLAGPRSASGRTRTGSRTGWLPGRPDVYEIQNEGCAFWALFCQTWGKLMRNFKRWLNRLFWMNLQYHSH